MADDLELNNISSGNALTFHNVLPGEVKRHIENNPASRRLFRVTGDAGKAGGADALGQLGDRYWQMVDNLAGSDVKTAKGTAANSNDPAMQFWAAVHENLPEKRYTVDPKTGKRKVRADDRVPQVGMDPAKLGVGQEFELNGSKFQVIEDEDGYRFLKDGDDYPVTPIDALAGEKIPVDKGTLRQGEEPELPEGGAFDDLPSAPQVEPSSNGDQTGREQAAAPVVADGVPTAGGGTGLFGQPTFEAKAGGQEKFGFGMLDDAAKREKAKTFSTEIERKVIPLPEGEQLGSASANDPKNTPEMFGRATPDVAQTDATPSDATPNVAPIPDRAALEAMTPKQVAEIAKANGVPLAAKATNIEGLMTVKTARGKAAPLANAATRIKQLAEQAKAAGKTWFADTEPLNGQYRTFQTDPALEAPEHYATDTSAMFNARDTLESAQREADLRDMEVKGINPFADMVPGDEPKPKKSKAAGSRGGKRANDNPLPETPNDGIPFSVRSKPEYERDLVASHNLNHDNLLHADKMGGLAMPSVAITRDSIAFDKYGDVTLIGRKGLIDPERSDARVFDADIYSPTMPRAVYKPVRTKDAEKVFARFKPALKATDDRHMQGELWDRMVNSPDKDRLLEDLKRSRGAMLAFLQEKGVAPEPVYRRTAAHNFWTQEPAFLEWADSFEGKITNLQPEDPEYRAMSEAVKRSIAQYVAKLDPESDAKTIKTLSKSYLEANIDPETGLVYFGKTTFIDDDLEIARTGKTEVDGPETATVMHSVLKEKGLEKEYESWLEQNVGSVFGEPLVEVGRSKRPYTLENAVEAMGKRLKATEANLTFGPGAARAAAAKEFKNVDSMHRDKGRIAPEEDVKSFIEAKQDKAGDAFRKAVLEHFTQKDWRGNVDTWAALDASMKALGQSMRGGKKPTPAAIRSALHRNGFSGFPDSAVEAGMEAARTLRDAPTQYFEGKISRAVKLEEFAGAIVPEGVPSEVIEALDRRGIPHRTYKKGDDADRQRAAQAFRRELDTPEDPTMFSVDGTRPAPEDASRDQQTANSIRQQLKAAHGIDADFTWLDAPIRPGAGITPHVDRSGVGSLARMLGRKVRWFKSDPRLGGFRIDDAIALNADSPKAHLAVFGHEFGHDIEINAPDLFSPLVSAVRSLNPNDFDAAAQKKIEAGYSEKSAPAEVLADTMGDHFIKPDFWQHVAREMNTRGWSKLRMKLAQWTTKLMKFVKGEGFGASRMFRDLETVRGLLAKTTVEYVSRRAEQTGTTADLSIIAWHGSPHDFDKFTTKKMGTGEGAQVYGWGMYFAGRREIAEHYQKVLSAKGMTIDGESFTPGNYEINRIVSRNLNDEAAIASALRDYVAVSAGNPYANLSDAEKIIDAIDRGAFKASKGGRLYQTELSPDEHELLDWDASLAEQSPKVKAALEKLGWADHSARIRELQKEHTKLLDELMVLGDAAVFDRAAYDAQNERARGVAAEIYKLDGTMVPRGPGGPLVKGGRRAKEGRGIYTELADRIRGGTEELPTALMEQYKSEATQGPPDEQKYASLLLRSLGIRGIKFADAASRGGQGIPTDVRQVLQDVGWLGFDSVGEAAAALRQHRTDWKTRWETGDADSDAVIDRWLAAKDDATHNYVIFDDDDVSVTAKLSVNPEDEATRNRMRPRGSVQLSKPQRPASDTGVAFEDKTVEKRYQDARGVDSPSLLDKLKEGVGNIKREFTRHFIHLDLNNPEDSKVANTLRLREAASDNAPAKALRQMSQWVGDMVPAEYDRFGRMLVLPDILKDIDAGRYDGKSLPFGFTDKSHVEHELQRMTDTASLKVKAAIDKRNAATKELTEKMVDLKLLNPDVLEDDRYFHRQVMEYMDQKRQTLGGKGPDAKLRKRGFQKARVGGGDFNTEYSQAEHEYLTHAHRQIAAAEALQRIEKQLDIAPKLRSQAKKQNTVAAFGGEAKYTEYLRLRRELAETEPGPDGREARRRIHDELDPLWVTHHEDSQIAQAIDRLEETAMGRRKIGVNDDGSPEYDYDDESTGSPLEVAQRVIAIPDRYGEKATIAARWLMKSIANKKAKIQELAGDEFVTWQDLVPDDHAAWSPKAEDSFANILSIQDHVVERVITGNKELSREDVKEVLAKVPGKILVLPEHVANQLDEQPQTDDTTISRMTSAINASWKQWTLLSPFRALKYNVNNMSGDTDVIFAADPIILKHVKEAVTDLHAYSRKKGAATDAEIEQAMDLGVTGSGITLNEIPDISSEKVFRELTGGKADPLRWYWDKVRGGSTFRENVMRLAAFRRAKELIAAGREPMWASKPSDLAAVSDPQERAAKLSRELLGDYGNISSAGQLIRRRYIPFWSWMEINAPRYARLFTNSVREGNTGHFARGMALKAAKAPAKFAVNRALSPVSTVAGATALYTLVHLFNAAMFPDDDDGFEDGRLRLLLGKNSEGRMFGIRFQGAFSDALSWGGLENAPAKIAKMARGEQSAGDTALEMAKAAPSKIINAAVPIQKTAVESLVGKTLFPDPFNPRPIRDAGEHLSRLIGADPIYRYFKDIPQGDAKDFAGQLLLQSFSPGEERYKDLRGKAYRWLEQNGSERGAGEPTERSNALFYHRRALSQGNKDQAGRWLERYYKLGGTKAGLATSLSRAHPLDAVPRDKRQEFIDSLSTKDRTALESAEDWYFKTYYGDRASSARETRGFRDEINTLRDARDAYSAAKKNRDMKTAGEINRTNRGFGRLRLLEQRADLMKKWDDAVEAGKMTREEADRRTSQMIKATMKKAG